MNVSSESTRGQENSLTDAKENVTVLNKGERRVHHVLSCERGDNRVQHVRLGVPDVCLPQGAPRFVRNLHPFVIDVHE